MIKTNYLFFAVGAFGLLMSYILLGNVQYFSALSMLSLILSAFASIALLGMSYFDADGHAPVKKTGMLLTAFVFLFVALESVFVIYGSSGAGNALSAVATSAIANSIGVIVVAALAVGFAYAIGTRTAHLDHIEALLIIAACIIIAAGILGQIEYFVISSQSAHVVGTDELALGYDAARVFVSGMNPYKLSFAQNLTAEHITPTFFLNGTCQCDYSYPALSFISMIPLMAIAGSYDNFLVWALVATSALTIGVLASLFRRYPDKSRQLLLPSFIVSAAVFSVGEWAVVKYIVMLALVLAYVYRDRPLLYPVLLGCAASLHQIGLIAVPFFILLSADENGWKYAVRAAIRAALFFMAVNAYFLYISGTTMLIHVLDVGSAWLVPRGVTVMQFLMAFYPVQYNYSSLFFILLYLEMLAAFHLFKRARFLVAIMAPLVFMFSTSNSITYAIPFMPLLLLMIAEKRTKRNGEEDIAKENVKLLKRGLVAGTISFVLFFCAVIVYSHAAFAGTGALTIGNATGVLQGAIGGKIRLTAIMINVCSAYKLNGSISLSAYGVRPHKTGFALLTLSKAQEPDTCAEYPIYLNNENYSPASAIKVQASAGRDLSAMRRVNFVYYPNLNGTGT